MSEIRVAIVDDQPMIRMGLSMMIGHEADLTVVGEAGDGAAAITLVDRTRPDVVVMDIRMPGMDGLEAARLIRTEVSPSPRIVVLTTFDDDEYVLTAMADGAAGFLLKDAEPHQIADAVRRVHRGEAILDPAVTGVILDNWRNGGVGAKPEPESRHADEVARLTEREREVLAAVARGGSNKEIATGLYLSEATVKSHVHALLTKLDLTSRTQLVVFAYEAGIA